MTAINFPANPQLGDTFLNFAWDGEKWRNAGSRASAVVLKDLFEFSVAADDSTQRIISTGESIKFTGAGTVSTASDAEGNITITGAATSIPTIYSSAYIGTTSLDFTRSSASQTLNGVSIDGSVTWTNPSPAPGDPWRTAISAASGNANIVLYSGVPGFGTSVDWTFSTTGITFPDNTEQTTAFTGSVAYASVTGTPTLATVATSGSYTDLTDKPTIPSLSGYATETFVTTRGYLTSVGTISYNDLSNKPTLFDGAYASLTGKPTLFSGSYTDLTDKPTIPTTVTVNGTSITLNSSGTVTAAAGTLTGTTLNSTVVTSSLTSVGTLTGLTTSGAASITYTPGTATGVAITATGKDTQGGTGFFDFLKATNTTSGVTNANKTFRLNSTGTIEVINSAYSATIMSLTDAGAFSVASTVSSTGFYVNNKQAVNGPAFRAYIASGQTITNGSQQKVTFGTETFDTNSNFASSRFTPTVEGYYQLNATVRIAGTSGGGEVMITIWKNGSEYSRGTNEGGTEQGSNFYSMQVSDLAYANGSTDYFEIYIQQSSGGNRDTTAGSNISYFSGCMIRGA